MTEFVRTNYGLENRVCVVTGAGSGIGRSTVLALAEVGARVAALDISADGVEETAALVRGQGGSVMAAVCDVSDPDAVVRARSAVLSEFGEADVLVNNAGMLQSGALGDLPLEDWNRIISVNLTGYFLCAQAFGRPMAERGSGALVHTASIAAVHPTANLGAYGITKAGITMMSKQFAAEWGPRGVRSNVVHPGMIRTPFSEAAYSDPAAAAARARAASVGRYGTPEDVATVIVFLAGVQSAYVSGTEILVDGALGVNLMSLIPRF